MSTSVTTGLSEPIGSEKISIGTLGYVRTRNKQRLYDLVIREFKKSGLRNIDLANRLDKAPEVVHRLLSRPQNWEADTLSDLLFAICGGMLKVSIDRPFAPAVDVAPSTAIIKINQSKAYQALTQVRSDQTSVRAA
jgi:hypothetical protein